MTTNPPLSKRVLDSLAARSATQQWEELIANLLKRLELDPAARADAELQYGLLADQIARKLSLPGMTYMFSRRDRCAHRQPSASAIR